MLNIIIWEMDNYIIKDVFEELEKENIIQIVTWFRTKDVFKKNSEKYSKQYFWQDLVNNEIKSKEFLICPEEIYDKIYCEIYKIMDLFSRSMEFEVRSIHDFLNIINMYINAFYSFLKRKKVDAIFFGSLPHEGANYILYLLSKIMNIKIVMVLQSVFPNRFHYCYDIEDFGEFKNIKENSEIIKNHIPNKFEKDLFYMKDSYEKIRKIEQKNDSINWMEKKYTRLKMNLQKYNSINDYLIKKAQKKISRYDVENSYKKNYKKNSIVNVNLNCDFVYFPLHLQPEMTTSIMGGVYCDQLLAIERLSRKIPSKWKIYVKENPKQTSYMRGEYFFERLKLLKNVILINSKYNTYELIEKSKFVATITGTAGWEAISGGKNVLVFGKAWYKSLPGVFQYNEKIDISDIVGYKINHRLLEEQVDKLLSKMGYGIIDSDYVKSIDNFDFTDNKNKLIEFYKLIIRNL